MTAITFASPSASCVINCSDGAEGDVYVAIEVAADGFTGHADGHVAGASWSKFVAELAQLERIRGGMAHLRSELPDEFELSVCSLDQFGHVGVDGVLRFQEHGRLQQLLQFAFEFDPSQLAAAVTMARSYLKIESVAKNL